MAILQNKDQEKIRTLTKRVATDEMIQLDANRAIGSDMYVYSMGVDGNWLRGYPLSQTKRIHGDALWKQWTEQVRQESSPIASEAYAILINL